MVTHKKHLENTKEIKEKLAVIYGEILNIVSKDHEEYSDWFAIRRIRDDLEEIIFYK